MSRNQISEKDREGFPLFFWVLFLLLFGLFLYLLRSFLTPLLLGAITATLLFPAKPFLKRYLRWDPLVSFLLTLAIFLLFLTFLFYLSLFLLPSLREALSYLPTSEEELGKVVERFQQTLNKVLPYTSLTYENLLQTLQNLLRTFAEWGVKNIPALIGTGVAGIFTFFVDLFLYFLTLYTLLREGETLVKHLRVLSPLPETLEDELIATFKNLGFSLLVAGFVTALAQASLAGIGFLLAGTKGIPLLTFLTFFSSFIPFFGTALVWVPTGLYTLFAVSTSRGIFLLLYGTFVISMVDQIIKPLWLKTGVRIPTLLLFLSVFSGILSFGGVGIFLGPLLISFFLSFYRVVLRHRMESTEKTPNTSSPLTE